MTEKILSITEIQNFRDNNPKIIPQNGGMITFTAKITYVRPNKKDIIEITKVSIDPNGYRSWDISIETTGEIINHEVYTSFSPKFQTYKYDSEQNILSITAETSKKGPYKLIIDPN